MRLYPIVQAAPPQARLLIDRGWFVLDVRSNEEWAEGRIPGSTHMPLSEVVAGIGSRVVEPLLVVSRQGGAGWRVAAYLRHQGIEAANLHGGMFAWELAGHTVER